MQTPTLTDIYAARERVYRVVRPTPLLRHPMLAVETGVDILVKHENHNPTGAFKVRGGLNLIGSLPAAERRGVITATTGNHGQSIALACARERIPCTIVTPAGNNPEKNAAMTAATGTSSSFRATRRPVYTRARISRAASTKSTSRISGAKRARAAASLLIRIHG